MLSDLLRRGHVPIEPHALHKCAGGGFGYVPIRSSGGGFLLSLSPEVPFDLRLFVDPNDLKRADGSSPECRRICGAVRFSEYAQGARGLADDYVHGGAIEAVLDEVTAECATITLFSEAFTTRFEARIKAYQDQSQDTFSDAVKRPRIESGSEIHARYTSHA